MKTYCRWHHFRISSYKTIEIYRLPDQNLQQLEWLLNGFAGLAINMLVDTTRIIYGSQKLTPNYRKKSLLHFGYSVIYSRENNNLWINDSMTEDDLQCKLALSLIPPTFSAMIRWFRGASTACDAKWWEGKKTASATCLCLGHSREMLNPPTTPPPAFACERTRIDRWFQLRCATTDGIVGLLILKSRCCSVNLRIQCEKCRNKTGFVHEHQYVTECVFFQLVYPALFWAWPGRWCSRGWDAGVVR